MCFVAGPRRASRGVLRRARELLYHCRQRGIFGTLLIQRDVDEISAWLADPRAARLAEEQRALVDMEAHLRTHHRDVCEYLQERLAAVGRARDRESR